MTAFAGNDTGSACRSNGGWQAGTAAESNRRWYVVHTKPNNEQRVSSNLRCMTLEALCPMLAEDYVTLSGVRKSRVKPLFPGYVFGRFNLVQHWHSVRFTRGVREVVSAAGRPLAVDDEIIDIVTSRIGEEGVVRIGVALEPGDRVSISGGPFHDLVGVFESRANDHTRITVLLTAVNWSAHVDVPRELVHRI